MDIPQSTPTVPVSTEEISDETTTIRHHHLNKVIEVYQLRTYDCEKRMNIKK